jgi:arginase
VETEIVEPETAPPAEISTGFELMRCLAVAVKRTVKAGRFPIVLSGNCNAAIGTLGGLGGDIGVVWFDAHGDFNTPETTTSGFLDGTGLATLVGRCWKALAATVPGFQAVPEADVVLAGAHDLDPSERAALESSRLTVLPASVLRDGAALRRVLEDMARRVRGVYLHVDPDVVDPKYGRANRYAVPGGISPAELRAAVEEVGRRLVIRAVGVASYDPETDVTGAICDLVLEVVPAAVAFADGAE